MKINIFLAIIIFSTQLFINANSYYKLDHPVIQMLDGIKEAMDGAAIWDIERVRWHMRRMHVGKLDKATQKFTGIYDLNGQKYSILELAKIEAEAEQAGNQELLQKLNAIHNSAVKEFLIFVLLGTAGIKSADGDLDPTFNPSGTPPGIVVTLIGTNNLINSIAIQN